MKLLLSRVQSGWAISRKINLLAEKSLIQTLKTLSLSEVLKDDEVSILLASDKYIKDLNKHHRGKDKPTNVLSFSYMKFKEGKLISRENTSNLGDVIISYETCKKEAEEQGKNFYDHVTHLFVHSYLHLLGFDHEKEKPAKNMEDLEIKILAKLGINNPY